MASAAASAAAAATASVSSGIPRRNNRLPKMLYPNPPGKKQSSFEYEDGDLYFEDGWDTGPIDAGRALQKMVGARQVQAFHKKQQQRRDAQAEKTRLIQQRAVALPEDLGRRRVAVPTQTPVERTGADLPLDDASEASQHSVDGFSSSSSGMGSESGSGSEMSDTARPAVVAAAAAAAAAASAACGEETVFGVELANPSTAIPPFYEDDTTSSDTSEDDEDEEEEAVDDDDEDEDDEEEEEEADVSSASDSDSDNDEGDATGSGGESDLRSSILSPACVFALHTGARVQLWWTQVELSAYFLKADAVSYHASAYMPEDTLADPPDGSRCTADAWRRVAIYNHNPLMVQLLKCKLVCFAWYKHVMQILVSHTKLKQRVIANQLIRAVHAHRSKLFPHLPPPTYDQLFPKFWLRPGGQRGLTKEGSQQWADEHRRLFPVYILPFISIFFTNPSHTTITDADADTTTSPEDDPSDLSSEVPETLTAAAQSIREQEAAAADAREVFDAVLQPNKTGEGEATHLEYSRRIAQLGSVLCHHVSCSQGSDQAQRGMVYSQFLANSTHVQETVFNSMATRLGKLEETIRWDRSLLTKAHLAATGREGASKRWLTIEREKTKSLRQENQELRRSLEQMQRKRMRRDDKGKKKRKNKRPRT